MRRSKSASRLNPLPIAARAQTNSDGSLRASVTDLNPLPIAARAQTLNSDGSLMLVNLNPLPIAARAQTSSPSAC